MQSINLIHRHGQEIQTSKKCDADADVDADADADVHVNADDRGDNNSSMHFVQAS